MTKKLDKIVAVPSTEATSGEAVERAIDLSKEDGAMWEGPRRESTPARDGKHTDCHPQGHKNRTKCDDLDDLSD